MSQNYFSDNIYKYDNIRLDKNNEISYNFTPENINFDRNISRIVGNGFPNMFGKRFGHQATEYLDRVFVIGGTEIGLQNTGATHFNVMNDIWGSINGEKWIKCKVDTKWTIEDYSQAKMTSFPDISCEGFEFPKITGCQLVSTNNGIYIIGGIVKNTWDGIQPNRKHKYVFDNDSPLLTDKTDKTNETDETDKTNENVGSIIKANINKIIIRIELDESEGSNNDELIFKPYIMITNFTSVSNITNHKCIKFKNSIYLFDYNSVWRSKNFSKWEQLSPISIVARNNQFTYRRDYEVVVLEDNIFVLGGYDGTDNLNDIWSSTDCINWEKIKDNAEWNPRHLHKCCVIRDANETEYVLLIGGKNVQFGDTKTIPMSYGDIWYSRDCINWIESGIKVSNRNGSAVCSYGNKSLVIGGCYDTLLEYSSSTWAIDAYNDVFLCGEEPEVQKYEILPTIGSILVGKNGRGIRIGRTVCTWQEYQENYKEFIREDYRPKEINGEYDINNHNPKSIVRRI